MHHTNTIHPPPIHSHPISHPTSTPTHHTNPIHPPLIHCTPHIAPYIYSNASHKPHTPSPHTLYTPYRTLHLLQHIIQTPYTLTPYIVHPITHPTSTPTHHTNPIHPPLIHSTPHNAPYIYSNASHKPHTLSPHTLYTPYPNLYPTPNSFYCSFS